jgi:hypothetical protein
MVLSLPHAKRLLTILAELFTEHELMFGEVHADIMKRLTPEGIKRVIEKQEKRAREKENA